jgi:hypothetical protein
MSMHLDEFQPGDKEAVRLAYECISTSIRIDITRENARSLIKELTEHFHFDDVPVSEAQIKAAQLVEVQYNPEDTVLGDYERIKALLTAAHENEA